MHKTPELFDERNTTKKHLEFGGGEKTKAEAGELRWYYEGINIGNEISKDGKFMRVCLVLNNNLGNGLIMIMPITTKYHQRMEKYYIPIQKPELYRLKTPQLIINQTKSIDPKRLQDKLSEKKLPPGFIKKVLHIYRDHIKH